MNPEYLTMYQATGAGLGLVIASFFYSWGGRSGKWRRRFIGSFILAGTLNLLLYFRGMWSPWILTTYPILACGFSLGYGAQDLSSKLFKRLMYALAVLMAGVVTCFVVDDKTWLVLIPHCGVAAWSIYLGVVNTIEAAAEEFWVCILLNAGLMMYPFL